MLNLPLLSIAPCKSLRPLVCVCLCRLSSPSLFPSVCLTSHAAANAILSLYVFVSVCICFSLSRPLSPYHGITPCILIYAVQAIHGTHLLQPTNSSKSPFLNCCTSELID